MAFDFPSGVDLDDGYQVINPETGATYRWKEDPGKWVLVTPLSSAAGRRPIFAPSEPSEHPDYTAPDSNLQIGDIWYDTSDELAQHIWDGAEWVAVDERYVQVKGDVMTGPLLMNDGDELDPQPLKIDADDQAVHKIYADSLKAHIYVGEKGPDTTDLPIGTLWYDNDPDDLTLYLWTGKEWTTAAPPVSTDGAITTLAEEVSQALAAARRADGRSASNQSAIIEIARAVGSIQDGLGQVTLQEVLDNGNVADKGAEFGGKVIVEPGTTGNEAVTYQQMLDSSTGNYLPITGGDLAGNLTVNGTGESGTAPFIVRKDGYYTSLVVDRSGSVYAGVNETSYFNASKPSHLITKGHLDNRLLHPGMGLRWKYSSGDTTPAGYFAISGNFSFRISHTTHDGEDYFETLCSKDHGSKTLHCLLTVYQISAGKYKPCEVFELRKCRFGRNSSQMEFEYEAKAQAHSLTNGNIYYITVGGLF